jgi:trimeric autotransporter adhesin
MKANEPGLKWLALVTGALVWCAVNLHGQSGPTITTQPASQTNLAGTSVAFSVEVEGAGPFNYQWQFNGTNLPVQIITVAGNGSATWAGDGGASVNAGLHYPSGVAFDAVGNLYIADLGNARIRKVDTNGIITTVVGNGSGTYAGDGGAATNASLYNPTGVALDAVGNLFIADSYNHRIRKVDTNGIITTVAGNGSGTYSGDGGAATNASLHYPWGVTFDAFGNFYIADQNNNYIRKVDTNGIISSVAGNGNEGYAGDNGPATNASIRYPASVALDAADQLYFAEFFGSRVRKVDTNGIISTFAGGGSGTDGGAATNASLINPAGVAFDSSGNLYISDLGGNCVRQVDNSGMITTVAGSGGEGYSGDGGAATNASLAGPRGIALDAFGGLIIADSNNNRIRKVYLAGNLALTLTDLTTNNAGNYTVVITSPYGSVTSAVATLTVDVPPAITVQPASQRALPGVNVTLSVTATGDPPLYYSWYFNATNLMQSGTSASFIVTNVSTANAGPYTVVVTNFCGSATSQVAILTAELPPTITAQPASQTVLVGSDVLFRVALDWTGPFSYQWQSNGIDFPTIISTVAGGGFGGDGGAATNANLNGP